MHFVEGFPQDQLQVCMLYTVTYGTKPASFLAVRAMHKLSADEHTAFPLGAEFIRLDLYVDDLISGAKSKEEAVSLFKNLRHQFASDPQLPCKGIKCQISSFMICPAIQ